MIIMNNVDEYIESFSDKRKDLLKQLRQIIKETIPEVEEKISWGVPTYYYQGYLLQIAGNKNHVGFYTTPTTLAYFKDELKDYKTNGKNTMQIYLHQEIPTQLIKKMILFRVKENTQ